MKRMTAEEAREVMRRAEQQQKDDAEAARALMASPGGAALIRYLEKLWGSRGIGRTPEMTAYRLGHRDALETLKDIRKDGEHA